MVAVGAATNAIEGVYNIATGDSGGGKGGSVKADPSYPAQSGGRSGAGVKDLKGPSNSAIRGAPGRVYVTDADGNVVRDITVDRVKPVTPGKGFGDKRTPTQEELDLIKQLWP